MQLLKLQLLEKQEKGLQLLLKRGENLANRSAEAAKEIKDIVEGATLKANEGKNIVF